MKKKTRLILLFISIATFIGLFIVFLNYLTTVKQSSVETSVISYYTFVFTILGIITSITQFALTSRQLILQAKNQNANQKALIVFNYIGSGIASVANLGGVGAYNLKVVAYYDETEKITARLQNDNNHAANIVLFAQTSTNIIFDTFLKNTNLLTIEITYNDLSNKDVAEPYNIKINLDSIIQK